MFIIRKKYLLIILDTMTIIAAVFISYLLRFEGNIPSIYLTGMTTLTICILVAMFVLLYYKKLYSTGWKMVSMDAIILIAQVAALSYASTALLYFFSHYITSYSTTIPLTIFPLACLLTIFGLSSYRLIWKIYIEFYQERKPNQKKALIYGAGSAGCMVAKELKYSLRSPLYPEIMLDDDTVKTGLKIVGVPVIGTREDLLRCVDLYGIEVIIIAIPSLGRKELSLLVSHCQRANIEVKIVPYIHHIIQDHQQLSKLLIRDVRVEDLLGRDQIMVNDQQSYRFITGKVVLITGAGGSIGSELSRQIASYKPLLLLLIGRGENSIFSIEQELIVSHADVNIRAIIADVQDEPRIAKIFKQYTPQVVFHAAAHKHVPLMEQQPMEAIKNNVFGTKNVAENAHFHHAETFVLISSDKAVNPTSVMGASKRLAEMVVQGLNQMSDTNFVSVRFGNVLGSRGSVIPLFKKQIEAGGPVTVTHQEMVRYFMTIPEAVQLVIHAGAMSTEGKVYVLDMGDPIKIKDLAQKMIQLSGLKLGHDIEITYTGVRPGEKLFEEIFTEEEETTATKHERIYSTASPHVIYSIVLSYLDSFHRYLKEEYDPEEIKVLLKEIIPTYSYSNSSQNENLNQAKHVM